MIHRIFFYPMLRVALGFWLFVSTVSAFADTSVTIQLRWDNQFQFAGYYAAQWQGYYKAEGLDVTIKSAVTDQGIISAVEAVESGIAQFGIGGADILMARDRGVPLMVVASIFQHSAAGFYSRKGTQLDSPADFLKLKVARRVNDLIDIELQALLMAEGIDPAGVTPYPHQAGMDHLVSGLVDVVPGYTISFPFEAEKNNLSISTFRPLDYGIDFYGDSLFTTEQLVKEDQDLVTRFVRASLKGWEYALENREAIAEKITRTLPRTAHQENLLGFNLSQSTGVLKLTNYPEVDLGHMNPARWERMHQYLKRVNVLKHSLAVDELIFNPEKMNRLRVERQRKLLLSVVAVLVVGVILIGVWIVLLRRTVGKKTKDLLASNQMLMENERELNMKSSALENSLNGFDIVNDDGCFIYVNQAYVTMYGYGSAEEIIGTSPMTHCLDPKLPEKVIGRLKEKGEYEFEHTAKRKDGSTFEVLMYARLAHDEQGREIYPTTSIDISDKVNAQKERETFQMQLRQAQKMEAVGTLSGGIAHEFNNILGIVLGNAELAMDDIPDLNLTLDFLYEIKDASLRGKDIVRQLLSFSRKDDPVKKNLDLPEIIQESIKLLRASIPTFIKFETQVLKDCHTVVGDQTQIHQVMINLCNNAAHAMEDTGGILVIKLENITLDRSLKSLDQTIDPGDYVRLSVIDTGLGIPGEVIENIFDPFYTTKPVDKGTGLGLSVVHGIMRAHNGVIHIASQVGEGTCCECYFPVSSAPFDGGQIEEEIFPYTGTETILFVDDDPALVKMVQMQLERLGYRFWAEIDPVKALARFVRDPDQVDLIITDMTMPQMTGDQLIQNALAVKSDVKTIICTGYSSKIDEDLAQGLGASAYLMKPVETTQLARTIREVLDFSPV